MDSNETKHYTIVVSQYEKTTTIYYTLRAFCRNSFELLSLDIGFITKREIQGEWKDITAGGCPNHMQTYQNNPKYRLTLGPQEKSNLVIELRGPKVYQVGLELKIESIVDSDEQTAPFVTKSSGTYRSGFCVLDLCNLPAGVYTIVPSTYLPAQQSPFILNIKSTAGVVIARMQ